MKKIFFLILALSSVVLAYGQSDLGFEDYFAGAPGAVHYKGEEIGWSFTVSNTGISNASVVDYKIMLSEDQNLDNSDIELKSGHLFTNITNPTGLNAGNSLSKSELFDGYIEIPYNIEANKTYYFIFWIEQDIDQNEVNITNNQVNQAVYISYRNHVTIEEVNQDALGNKTPLLLVHGWQKDGIPAAPNTNIWNNFVGYFVTQLSLFENYKLYYVKYKSNYVSVEEIGKELRYKLDEIPEFHDRQVTIMAHSMGGLVSRAFAKFSRADGPFPNQKGGERVNSLITLGTPHHGSPMANGSIREQYLSSVADRVIQGADTYYFGAMKGEPQSSEYNRSDLRWDNYNNLYNYSQHSDEVNSWLTGNTMNGDPTNYFDDKIIAYGGYFPGNNTIEIEEYYVLHWIIKTYFGYENDGIVPLQSALFENHSIFKRRMFVAYFHDEIAKGKSEVLYDPALFGMIKADLLGIAQYVNLTYTWDEDNYPNTALGNVSSKTLTIQNSGNSILTVDSFQLIGIDNMDFEFSAPAIPFDLELNETATISLNFQPQSIGEKTVTFKVNNSSSNTPELDIQLSGKSVQTATTNHDTNTDSVYDFGDVYIYGTPVIVTMNVSNNSSAPFTIAGLDIVGINSNSFTIVQQPQLPKAFTPGETDIIIISFSPDTVGEKTAAIETSFQNTSIINLAELIGNGTNIFNDPNAPRLKKYEYWFNSNYADKQIVNVPSSSNANSFLNFFPSTTNLLSGLNTIHFRAKDVNGAWSAIVSEYVIIYNDFGSNTNNNIVNYEYWFDDNYNAKVTGTTDNENLIAFNSDINTSTLNKGLHKFHIRFKDNKQTWSSVQTDFIIKTNENALGFNEISGYRYWFNQDFMTVTSVNIPPTENFTLLDGIDMSPFTSETISYIHFQFKDIYGNWSSVITEEIFICGTITTPPISANGNLLSTINASAYQWHLDGVIIDGATNQYYEANEEGNYTVEITNADGCHIESEAFQFNTLSIENNENEYFRIFPNPTQNKVFIITKQDTGSLSIFNTTGQLVSFYDIIPNEIDISKLNSGVYFFKIKTDNKVHTEKIIKL